MIRHATTALLRIDRVTARYGPITALHEVSLTIAAGEAVALLGANGAGKSTLMKSIMGLISPTAGTIEFAGRPLARVSTADRARAGLGYSPEGRRVFAGMTVRENLEVAGRTRDRARQVDEIFALFPALEEKAATLGWQLSGGQQQMLAIGRALMTQPQLLLLDEPSLGLAPILTNEVIERVKLIKARGTAVLIAEQNGIEKAGHVREKLTWLISYAQTVRMLTKMAAIDCTIEDGIAIPNTEVVNIAKLHFASHYHQALMHVQDLAGGLLVTAPGEEDLKNPETRKYIDYYLGGREGVSAEQRLRTINLISDLTTGEFGGYQAVLAIHAEGSLEAEKLTILREYDQALAKNYALRIAPGSGNGRRKLLMRSLSFRARVSAGLWWRVL